MKFWDMLKNDATGNESKNKEIATLEERIRYTEYMAVGFAVLGAVALTLWWPVAVGCWLVAARKAWIALDKRDII